MIQPILPWLTPFIIAINPDLSNCVPLIPSSVKWMMFDKLFLLAYSSNIFFWANQVISIRQSYDYVLTHKAKATKTESSVRQVKVDKVTCSYLAEIVDDRPSLCRTSNKNEDGFIFVNRNSFKPISWSMVNKVLTRHCERAGIPRITTHAFRHTHISYLLNNDVYEQYVSERVGHSDTTMIRRVYGHVLDELKTKSDNKVIHLVDKQISSAGQ